MRARRRRRAAGALATILRAGSLPGPVAAASAGEDGAELVVPVRSPRWRHPDVSPSDDEYEVQLLSLILARTVAAHVWLQP